MQSATVFVACRRSGIRWGGRQSGFTLLEILIVTGIIGVLLLIAVPMWTQARRASRISILISDLRMAVSAFEQFAFYNWGRFPPEASPGGVPDGMHEYLERIKWTEPSVIGGQWHWMPNVPGFGHAVGVVNVVLDDAFLKAVDQRLDDGDLTAGRFRRTPDGMGMMLRVE